jgi:hypothetical protein
MLPFSKVWSYCLCAIAPVLALFYANRFSPNQRPIFLAVNGLCYFVYLLPYALFGAEVSIREDGLTIRQYGVARIPFADVRHSWCIFLAPFRVIVVITSSPFPRKVLIIFDEEQGPRAAFYGGPLTREWRARFKNEEGTAD